MSRGRGPSITWRHPSIKWKGWRHVIVVCVSRRGGSAWSCASQPTTHPALTPLGFSAALAPKLPSQTASPDARGGSVWSCASQPTTHPLGFGPRRPGAPGGPGYSKGRVLEGFKKPGGSKSRVLEGLGVRDFGSPPANLPALTPQLKGYE